MDRRYARNQALPQSEVELIHTLTTPETHVRSKALYEAGWTLRAIGEAFEPPRTRSTIRTWVLDLDAESNVSADSPASSLVNPVPEPQLVTDIIYTSKKPVSPGISPLTAADIQRLAPIARKYRSRINPHAPAALANSQLTAIVTSLYDRGVSVQELADAAGVTYRAMARRIKGS